MQQRTASTRGVAAAASSKSRNACSFIAQLRLGSRLHIHVYLQVCASVCVFMCMCVLGHWFVMNLLVRSSVWLLHSWEED